MESLSIMIEVLLEALKDVSAAIAKLAMSGVVVKVSIRITTQKTLKSTW